MIYYQLPFDRKANAKFGFHVFDNKLQQIWQKEITLPYQDKFFEVMEYEVDDKGNIHLLGKVYHNKKRVDYYRKKINYHYIILSYFNKGADFKEFKIHLEKKNLDQITLALNPNSEIILGGFYSNKNDIHKYKIDGVFFMRIDPLKQTVEQQSFKKFDIDFKVQEHSEKKKKRLKKKAKKGKDVEMENYKFKDIVLSKDGVIMVAEQDYYTQDYAGSGNNGQARYISVRRFNNIMLVKVDNQGQILWNKIIKKNQKADWGRLNNAMSYFLFLHKGNVYLLYNDISVDARKRKYYKTKMVTVHNDGTIDQKELPQFKNKQVVLQTQSCKKVGENEFILVGRYVLKKKYRLAKMSFKN